MQELNHDKWSAMSVMIVLILVTMIGVYLVDNSSGNVIGGAVRSAPPASCPTVTGSFSGGALNMNGTFESTIGAAVESAMRNCELLTASVPAGNDCFAYSPSGEAAACERQQTPKCSYKETASPGTCFVSSCSNDAGVTLRFDKNLADKYSGDALEQAKQYYEDMLSINTPQSQWGTKWICTTSVNYSCSAKCTPRPTQPDEF